MKTLVAAQHAHGPHPNGHDGCHARLNHGLCPGVQIAEWLNGLGEDDQIFGKGVRSIDTGEMMTNGDVRDNYLKAKMHVVPMDAELSALYATARRLAAELRKTKKRIRQITGEKS